MNSFLLTYASEESKMLLRYYIASDNSIKATIIKAQEAKELLQSFLDSKITHVRRKNETKEIEFANGNVLSFDDNRIFDYTGHIFDELIEALQEKITEYRKDKRREKEKQERMNVRNWQKVLPKGFVPRVNRTKSKNIGKLIVVGGSVVLLASGIAIHNLKDIPVANSTVAITETEIIEKPSVNEDEEVAPPIMEEYVVEKESVTPSFLEEEPIDCISIPFSYRVDNRKRIETENFCGDIIDYYSKRYGLPYNANCAQITQERPDIVNGQCPNICQIKAFHIGESYHVPVYDENGFTGTYDDFTVTEEMLNSLEGNIQFAIAYDRTNVDMYDNLTLGYFLYNQGQYALENACYYYGTSVEEYKKPENVLQARDLIVAYYKEKYPDDTYGDPLYLENIFSYLDLEDRGTTTLSYYVKDELRQVEIANANLIDKTAIEDYNNNLRRG